MPSFMNMQIATAWSSYWSTQHNSPVLLDYKTSRAILFVFLLATLPPLACAESSGTAPQSPQTTSSADEPDAPVTLPEVIVRERSETSYGNVTNRLKALRRNYPGTVNTVDPETLDRVKTHNLGEVLARIPGLNYIDEDGRGLRPDIGLRGLAPRRSGFVLLLGEGVPVQPSAYSEASAYYGVPAERVTGIEVIKGGASILYGPNAVGGAINYLYRPLSIKPLELVLDLRGGSDAEFMGNLFASGTRGGASYGVEYLHKRGDGFRDNNDYEINDVDARFIHRFSADHQVRGRFQYYDEDSSTPGALSPEQFARDITLSNKPNDRFFGERWAGDLRMEHWLTEHQKFETLFYANYFRRDWYIQDFARSTGFALANTNGQNLREFHVVGFEPRYTLYYDLGPVPGELLIGGRVYHDTLDRLTAIGPTPTSFERGSGTTTSDLDFSTLALAIFAQNRLQLTERFNVTPGLRYEYIEQTREDNVKGTEGTKYTDILLPGVGLMYDLGMDTRAYANVSRAFRPPTFSDVFDPFTSASRNLDASSAITYEVGLRGDPFAWFSFDLALFRFDFEDQVVISQNVAANFDTRSQGAEGTAEIGLFGLTRKVTGRTAESSPHEIYLTGGFTVQDTEFLSGLFTGNELPFAPEHMSTFGARYAWQEKASVQLQGRYIGEQFADNANTVPESKEGIIGLMPSYTVLDLNLNYRFSPSLSLFGGVRNLFDEEYIAERNTSFRGVVPGPDQTFYVGLTTRY